MSYSIKVEGLAALERKLSVDVLLDPPLEGVVDSATVFLTTQGRGLGAARNVITARELSAASEYGVTVTSTLNSPRTVGRAWRRYQKEKVEQQKAPEWLGKAAQDIEKTWGA